MKRKLFFIPQKFKFFVPRNLLISLVFVLFLVSGCGTTTIKVADCYLAERVIDGDTFVLQGGTRVRLIGIDTPETGEYYYQEAKMALTDLIMDKCMVLTGDVSETDMYDRLLYYVYVDGVFVQEYMVELGYAESYPYEPDVKYQEILNLAEERAKEKGIGIWNALIENCLDLGCDFSEGYVASKNSDLYHECDSSVSKRINRENILCFDSKQEAEELGFSAGSDVE